MIHCLKRSYIPFSESSKFAFFFVSVINNLSNTQCYFLSVDLYSLPSVV
jgi:hypothetical protein